MSCPSRRLWGLTEAPDAFSVFVDARTDERLTGRQQLSVHRILVVNHVHAGEPLRDDVHHDFLARSEGIEVAADLLFDCPGRQVDGVSAVLLTPNEALLHERFDVLDDGLTSHAEPGGQVGLGQPDHASPVGGVAHLKVDQPLPERRARRNLLLHSGRQHVRTHGSLQTINYTDSVLESIQSGCKTDKSSILTSVLESTPSYREKALPPLLRREGVGARDSLTLSRAYPQRKYREQRGDE